MNAALKRTDVKLLRDTMKSNGGGVAAFHYKDTPRKRLLATGLIQWKPNQPSNTNFPLLTITKAGKQALEQHHGE